jgi:LPS O-antigen subunit length determinant protein (WzzB/FepE family)
MTLYEHVEAHVEKSRTVRKFFEVDLPKLFWQSKWTVVTFAFAGALYGWAMLS